MGIPGFITDKALARNCGFQYEHQGFGVLSSHQSILPQLIDGGSFCLRGRDPCQYTCCYIVYAGPYNFPRVSCNTSWICGHRGPGTVFE